MPRRLRFVAQPGTLVETTCRTLQGRMLLRPGQRTLNDMIVGTLAIAKARYGVEVVCAVVMSNHFHLLLKVQDARQLARFQGFVNSKLAREIGRSLGWREKVWGRRYSAIAVSDEPAAQVARLRYLLSHGVKENLVARCTDWPGVHAAESLVSGRPLEGFWFDRTAEFKARRRGEDCGVYSHATPQTLAFERLPCWAELEEAEYQSRVAGLIAEIEDQARLERELQGIEPLGVEAIVEQDPQAKPSRVARSPAPLIHAASRGLRMAFRQAYLLFKEAYRSASEKLRSGNRLAKFPEGCFPPALAFVDL